MALIKLTPLLQCALIKIVTTKNNSKTYSKDVQNTFRYLTVKSSTNYMELNA